MDALTILAIILVVAWVITRPISIKRVGRGVLVGSGSIVLFLVFASLAGCAIDPGAGERADIRAAENYDAQVLQCTKRARVMLVKPTGTRIRGGYKREALLTAQCSQ